VEGRVCHKFKVPDRNGRLSLTLATETSKTDEGITTEMYREDNTEVEIHASSLETFVQTDKPPLLAMILANHCLLVFATL
jgi:hypothetical protein